MQLTKASEAIERQIRGTETSHTVMLATPLLLQHRPGFLHIRHTLRAIILLRGRQGASTLLAATAPELFGMRPAGLPVFQPSSAVEHGSGGGGHATTMLCITAIMHLVQGPPQLPIVVSCVTVIVEFLLFATDCEFLATPLFLCH